MDAAVEARADRVRDRHQRADHLCRLWRHGKRDIVWAELGYGASARAAQSRPHRLRLIAMLGSLAHRDGAALEIVEAIATETTP